MHGPPRARRGNAACDYAPVMMVNWEFMDNMTPESAVQLVDDLRAGTEIHSTRGPRVVTWREAERVLAGVPDDPPTRGPAAGAPSLVGRASRAPTAGPHLPPPPTAAAAARPTASEEAVEQAGHLARGDRDQAGGQRCLSLETLARSALDHRRGHCG